MNEGPLEKLKEVAKRLGGQIVELSIEAFDNLFYPDEVPRSIRKGIGIYEAPFTNKKLGVDWPNKTIYYAGEVFPAEVVHEMGHVFASKENPDDSEEFDFLGWEYVLAKQVGLEEEWFARNYDYGLGERHELEHRTGLRFRADVYHWLDFGRLSKSKQKELLRERVRYAKSIGIMGNRQKLRSIRDEA